MAGKTSKKPPKAVKKAAAKRVAARTTEPRKTGTKSAVPEPTKAAAEEPPSKLIDQRIRDLGGWRGETLARMRALILEADPEVTEETKWMGTPVWSHHGIVCTGEAYKNVVKLTFAQGAKLSDPKRLFNSSLEGNTRRAIDIHLGETVDARAFKALVKAAVAQNAERSTASAKAKPRSSAARAVGVAQGTVVLLSGGNPQIAKGDGDAPVQAYIAAMPGWKSGLGRRLDALVERNVPNARKAVKWNSPFYGIEGQGWFMSFHVLTHYVKVTFFNGTSLHPVPPGATERSKESRWIDIREDDELDEAQMGKWLKQAAALPGWVP